MINFTDSITRLWETIVEDIRRGAREINPGPLGGTPPRLRLTLPGEHGRLKRLRRAHAREFSARNPLQSMTNWQRHQYEKAFARWSRDRKGKRPAPETFRIPHPGKRHAGV